MAEWSEARAKAHCSRGYFRTSSLMLCEGFRFRIPVPITLPTRFPPSVVWFAHGNARSPGRLRIRNPASTEEIARLRAELERKDEELTQLLAWINGDSDALTVLQRTYMDPRISTSDRIKACGAAIGYERYKLTLAVSARSSDVLGDCLDAAKALKTVNPKVIEHDPPSGP